MRRILIPPMVALALVGAGAVVSPTNSEAFS